MANQNTQIFNIDLKGELITTKNKNEIKQFTGFKDRNCLVANNSLKRFKKSNTPYIYDDNGNYYSLKNGEFKINGITKKTVNSNMSFISKTEIELSNEGKNNVIWNLPYNSNGTDFKAIQTSTTLYIYKKINSVWSLENTYEGIFTILSDEKALVLFKFKWGTEIIVIYDGRIIVYENTIDTGNREGLNFAIKENNNIPYFLFKIIPKNNEQHFPHDGFGANITLAPDNNYYYFDLLNGNEAGVKTLDNMCFKFFSNNKIIDIQAPNAYTTFISESIFEERVAENENGYFWISNEPGYNGCLYERGSADFTFNPTDGIEITSDFQNKNITPFKASYNVDNKIDPATLVTVSGNSEGRYDYDYNEISFIFNFFDCLSCSMYITGSNVIFQKKYTLRTANVRMVFDVGHIPGYTYLTAEAARAAGVAHARELTFTNTNMYLNSLLQNEQNFTSNLYINDEVYLGATNDLASLNYISKSTTSFDLVFNSGTFANLSWSTKIFEPWLIIDTSNCLPIWSESKNGYYYYLNNKWYLVTETANSGNIEFILDRYILLNVKLNDGDVYNLYDTLTGTWFNYASDWDNRVIIGHLSGSITPIEITSSNYNGVNFDIEIAAGDNVNYKTGNVATAIFNPIILSGVLPFGWGNRFINENNLIYGLIHLQFRDGYSYPLELYFSTTLINATLKTPPEYVANYDNYAIYTLSLLNGLLYPIDTNGDIVFNVPLTADYVITTFDIYYIYINNVYYQLNTLNNEILLMYNYGSGLPNITQLFSIQGNIYIIRNNIISSCTISENTVQNIQSVISCKNLIFMGTNINTAFFYSPATKKILGFVGSRNFEEIAEFPDIETLYNYYYAINFKTFFILSNIGCICISDEGYISLIKTSLYNDFALYNKSFGLYDIEKNIWDIFSLYENGETVPVKINTAFYGYGNNKVTVIDTWYIKLYAEDFYNGSIKLKVVSLTNKGTESEETEFLITSDMFDKVTNSYYLRYQPKLQRGVGLSLSIESDYDIIELSCSAIADTTVQLSKPFSNQNVINGGKI